VYVPRRFHDWHVVVVVSLAPVERGQTSSSQRRLLHPCLNPVKALQADVAADCFEWERAQRAYGFAVQYPGALDDLPSALA
jgi:hypothetical protein